MSIEDWTWGFLGLKNRFSFYKSQNESESAFQSTISREKSSFKQKNALSRPENDQNSRISALEIHILTH